jgi:hypothetical protein
MIEIFGPSYRYGGEILTKPEIIYVSDHHYDEEQQCFHIKTLLENSECDPMQHLVVFDHMNHEDELSKYNTLYLPVFLSSEAKLFADSKITANWSHKPYTFNFMINKARPNREFLLLMIEHFGLENFAYSLCWKTLDFRRPPMAKRTNNILYREIIFNSKVKIEPKYYTLGQETIMERGLRYGSVTNAENYCKLLKHNVFEPSCISLITEPCFYERETLKTEKTLMAMYGGTLPIWVGGWAIPQSLRDLGFDVFDDIVDHSYERMDDPWDRAYFAVERNLHLLRDPDRVRNFIVNNHARFQHNVDLIERNVFLDDLVAKITPYDDKTRYYLTEIARGFRFRMFADYQLLGELWGNSKKNIEISDEPSQRWG